MLLVQKDIFTMYGVLGRLFFSVLETSFSVVIWFEKFLTWRCLLSLCLALPYEMSFSFCSFWGILSLTSSIFLILCLGIILFVIFIFLELHWASEILNRVPTKFGQKMLIISSSNIHSLPPVTPIMKLLHIIPRAASTTFSRLLLFLFFSILHFG